MLLDVTIKPLVRFSKSSSGFFQLAFLPQVFT
jgi:hypothetical protein